jgi:hypothetical protein
MFCKACIDATSETFHWDHVTPYKEWASCCIFQNALTNARRNGRNYGCDRNVPGLMYLKVIFIKIKVAIVNTYTEGNLKLFFNRDELLEDPWEFTVGPRSPLLGIGIGVIARVLASPRNVGRKTFSPYDLVLLPRCLYFLKLSRIDLANNKTVRS